MSKIEASPAPAAPFNAPAYWKENIKMKGGDTTIDIHADIVLPDVLTFPVYQVRQIEFTDSRVAALVSLFTKGANVMAYTEPTKAELEQQIIIAKEHNNEEMAAEFETQIATAPETAELIVITNWAVEQRPSGHFTENDGIEGAISVEPNTFVYMKGFVITDTLLRMNDKKAIGDVAVLEENAIRVAIETLHQFGIDYMTEVELEKAQCYRTIDEAFDESNKAPISTGYLIIFAREIDGISGIISHAIGYNFKEEIHYKAPLYPEEVQIYVNEAGEVDSFAWLNPLEIQEKLSDNVALLPFEDIQQRVRDMLTFIHSYNGEPIAVKSVEMKMAIIGVKNKPDEAMVVPAWFINYEVTFDGSIKQDYMLALNAIDGGRMLELPVDISEDIQKQMDKDK
jgi:hypothetical protein